MLCLIAISPTLYNTIHPLVVVTFVGDARRKVMKDVLKGNSSADGEASSVDASRIGLALTQQGQGQVRLSIYTFLSILTAQEDSTTFKREKTTLTI